MHWHQKGRLQISTSCPGGHRFYPLCRLVQTARNPLGAEMGMSQQVCLYLHQQADCVAKELRVLLAYRALSGATSRQKSCFSNWRLHSAAVLSHQKQGRTPSGLLRSRSVLPHSWPLLQQPPSEV